MDWGVLVFGIVMGSAITSILIWLQRPQLQGDLQNSYFTRVAMSAVITAILGGLVLTFIDYSNSGQWQMTGTLFGSGWLLGGLLAAWIITQRLRRS